MSIVLPSLLLWLLLLLLSVLPVTPSGSTISLSTSMWLFILVRRLCSVSLCIFLLKSSCNALPSACTPGVDLVFADADAPSRIPLLLLLLPSLLLLLLLEWGSVAGKEERTSCETDAGCWLDGCSLSNSAICSFCAGVSWGLGRIGASGEVGSDSSVSESGCISVVADEVEFTSVEFSLEGINIERGPVGEACKQTVHGGVTHSTETAFHTRVLLLFHYQLISSQNSITAPHALLE